MAPTLHLWPSKQHNIWQNLNALLYLYMIVGLNITQHFYNHYKPFDY